MNSKTYFSLLIISILVPLLTAAAVAYKVSTLTQAPMLMVSLAIFALWVFTIIDAAKTKNINPMWIIGIALAPTIIMPIYFYKKYKNGSAVTA